MQNVIYYLHDQGDIDLQESAFNEVDNLVLAQLSYVMLDEIVPSIDDGAYITAEAAYEIYSRMYSEAESLSESSLTNKAFLVLKGMASSRRFRHAKLSSYENQFDEEEQKQFAALMIELDDGSLYVAFRGTDNHLASWQEDFSMSYQTAPSQVEAARYLDRVAANGAQPLRVGGHSKGGNLAMYAAMFCSEDVQCRIVEVYNNDGPGFTKQVLESSNYSSIVCRITRITPQYSVFGMLLDQIGGSHTIVQSAGSGIGQHDAMTWVVVGAQFVRLEKTDKDAALLCETLNQWVQYVDLEQRREFVHLLFQTLDEVGVKEPTDLIDSDDRKALSTEILVKLLGKDTKIVMLKLATAYVKTHAAEGTIPLRSMAAAPMRAANRLKRLTKSA